MFAVLKFEITLFSFLILFVFTFFVLIAWVTYKFQNQDRCLSPYTKKPMWRGEDIPLSSVEKIMSFLYYQNRSYDNRVFPMKKAMICRDTGKIFCDVVSFWGFSKIDWTFIQKRHPGVYVSWGSLSLQQQREIQEAHASLEGFQLEQSSSKILPQDLEKVYAYIKPGPLYVDINSKILIGWKCVPDTIFEVLIVQHPKNSKINDNDTIQKVK